MKRIITKSKFMDAFVEMGRADDFSYESKSALYDYIIEYEESCDTETELDVIALCCEYSEDSIENVLDSYSLKSLEELRENTQVVWHDDINVLYLGY